MSFWKRIFGRREDIHGAAPATEARRDPAAKDIDRVSCMDVALIIRKRVGEFVQSQGMVVVVQEGCRVQIHYFDGIARTSWGYNNRQFSTDMVGRTFLVGPPTVLALSPGAEPELAAVLQREFAQCEMSVGKLWKLDPTAWDFEAMEALHRNDVGIRISFNQLPAVK